MQSCPLLHPQIYRASVLQVSGDKSLPPASAAAVCKQQDFSNSHVTFLHRAASASASPSRCLSGLLRVSELVTFHNRGGGWCIEWVWLLSTHHASFHYTLHNITLPQHTAAATYQCGFLSVYVCVLSCTQHFAL